MKPQINAYEKKAIEDIRQSKLDSIGADLVESEEAAAKPVKKLPGVKGKGKAKKIKKGENLYEIQPFTVGDTVDVHYRIVEGDKTRIQVYTGTVIRKKGGGLRETFTVRRIVAGEGVERVFPMHSPKLMRLLVTRHGRARRAKLYYLRERVGKATKTKELVGDQAAKQRAARIAATAEAERDISAAAAAAKAAKATAAGGEAGEGGEAAAS